MCLFERQTPNFTPPPHPSNSCFLPEDNSSSSSQTGETGSFGIPYRSPAPGSLNKPGNVHRNIKKQLFTALRGKSLVRVPKLWGVFPSACRKSKGSRPGQGAHASFQPLPGHHLVPSEGSYQLAGLAPQNTNTWLPGQHLARGM